MGGNEVIKRFFARVGEYFRKTRLQYFFLLGALALAGLDRLTKWLVQTNLNYRETVRLIKAGDTEILNLFYCLNDGAAFSKFKGQRIFLIVLTSAIIAAVVFMMVTRRLKRPVMLTAGALIVGGGLGNLFDRIFNDGMVIDFIDVALINFPIFNFADICAVCGAALLAVALVADEVKELKKKRGEKKASAEEKVEAKDENN